jgi:hypothetical protein
MEEKCSTGVYSIFPTEQASNFEGKLQFLWMRKYLPPLFVFSILPDEK